VAQASSASAEQVSATTQETSAPLRSSPAAEDLERLVGQFKVV